MMGLIRELHSAITKQNFSKVLAWLALPSSPSSKRITRPGIQQITKAPADMWVGNEGRNATTTTT